MKFAVLTAAAIIGVAGLSSPALAQSDSTEALLRRLEAKVDALSKQNDTLSRQNAALGERVRKMEGRSPAAKPATTAEPTADLNLSQAARTANAAYMPVKGGAAYRAPASTWSGVYVGGHGGWGFANFQNRLVNDLAPIMLETGEFKADGWLAGFHLGVNRQFGNWVLGGEISASYTDFKGSTRDGCTTLGGAPGICTSSMDWLVMGLGRLGYAWGDVLAFGHGGVAIAGLTAGLDPQIAGGFVPGHLRGSTTAAGGALGGGVEWMVARDFIFGIDYTHLFLNRIRNVTADDVNGSVGTTVKDAGIVRAKLSVKWGGE